MFFRRKYYCRGLQNGNITLQGAILVDVRSRQEYQEGHLAGAINIPEYEIIRRVEKEITKKNQLIVIYCQYGGRSRNVYIMMRKLGYTNVYNLYGGLDMM